MNLAFIALVVLYCARVANAQGSCPFREEWKSIILGRVNELRSKYGLAPVVYREDLFITSLYESYCSQNLPQWSGIEAAQTGWLYYSAGRTSFQIYPLETSLNDVGFNCQAGTCVGSCDTLAYILSPDLTSFGCYQTTRQGTMSASITITCKWVWPRILSTPSVPLSQCPPCVVDNCLDLEWCGSSSARCRDCFTGYYVNSDGQCSPCTKCTVGQFISAECDGYTNTVCTDCLRCAPGHSLVEYCPGTSTTDTTVCSEDVHCPLPENCEASNCWEDPTEPDGIKLQCTQCRSGYFIDSTGYCVACATCNIGQFISATCEGYTNTVCTDCTPCDEGTNLITPCPGTGTTDSNVCSTKRNTKFL